MGGRTIGSATDVPPVPGDRDEPTASAAPRRSVPRVHVPQGIRQGTTLALAALVVFSGYGLFTPGVVRCELPGAVNCPGGFFGPPAPAASSGSQWFNVTGSDYGIYIVDTVTGVNETNSWNLYEGYTININATSLPPDQSVGGTNEHGFGVLIGGSEYINLAGPVGSWNSGSFTAPTSPSTGGTVFCTIYCGPGHSSQRYSVVNVVAPPPSVTVSANPSAGGVPLPVSFTSTVSGGSAPYTYSWNFGDGTAASTAANPTHTYNVSGTFSAVLTVQDSASGKATARITVTVNAASSLVATASGTPLSGPSPLAVTLSGSATGGVPPYSYAWALGDGTTGTGSPLSHTYQSVGNYSAILTVTDSAGTKATSQVSISVLKSLPSLAVTASASPPSGTAPLSVTFTASASSGTSPYTAAWQFGDGSSGTGLSTTHSYTSAGSYKASVTVTDSTGRTGKGYTVVNVTGGVVKPLSVYITTNATQGSTPFPITALANIQGGTGSYSSVSWNMGDGTSLSGSSVTHTYTTAGKFAIQVTVTDSSGKTATNVTNVTAVGLGLAISLNASLGDAPFSVRATASVFGGTGSYGAVTWTWGDGNTNTGDVVNYTYSPSSVGNFVVTAVAQDSAGNRATNSTSVTIDPTDRATILANLSSHVSPAVVTLTLVPDTGSDLDAGQATWDFNAVVSNVTVIAPYTVTTNYTKAGSYLVTATTNDTIGLLIVTEAWVNISSPSGGGGGKPGQGQYIQPLPWLGNGVGDPFTDDLAVIFLLSLGLLYLLLTAPKMKPKPAPRPVSPAPRQGSGSRTPPPRKPGPPGQGAWYPPPPPPPPPPW